MKKLFIALFCTVIGGTAVAQWTPTTVKRGSKIEPSEIQNYYKLDISKLREQLTNAQETGSMAKPVEIFLPTLSGKLERFAVYSFPVVVKELADQYQLGSYVGVGIDDPSKSIRFSVAPNDFQSMMIRNGIYEFIDALANDKTLYSVHLKTSKGKEGFVCSSEESPQAKQQMNQLYQQGKSFYNQSGDFSKLSDKKYRTMRLVMSVTGEYTQFFGGTTAGALTQINATLTRVNFVFEKDFALHLNLQNYPQLIYINATTDPYDTVADANTPPSTWNQSLQTAITNAVGNDNYDIGHLFGASGGGGNSGCIGCVCVNPTLTVPLGKGAGITSPLTGSVNSSPTKPPSGDSFDIDFVAHEMGHQLSATHSFSHALQGGGAQMEPGSGSTIMGYAGITGANTDVQQNSDAYFHAISIQQVQANLISKTCDIETTTANNPPVIAPLQTYDIPKGTAFVLTASATDAENDPMTYTWEEMDQAGVVINKNNLGNTPSGASFRSLTPTSSPTRYFPKLSSVLNGVLDNSNNLWESVSKVARSTKFRVTVRDNNPNPLQQQTQFAEQTIIVGNNGPFKVNTQYANVSVPTAIAWDVANTNAAPYNVANVMIDYTTNNGSSWTTLTSSTPNDGTENFTFPSTLNGQTIKLRISSIGNVFYAIGQISVASFAPCDGSAPTAVTASNITTNGATINWSPFLNATYNIRYRIIGQTTWIQTTSTVPTVTLTGLTEGTAYEVQVSAVCSGTSGAYSPSTNFSTTTISYCTASSGNGQFNFISNLTLAAVNNTTAGSTYSDFTTNSALQASLVPNSSNNTISVTLTTTLAGASSNGMAAWIDFNRNGVFESTERVLNMPVTALPIGATPIAGSFAVPSTAVTDSPLRLRIVTVLINPLSTGSSIPDSFACGSFPNGEVEDYNVIVATALGTSEFVNSSSGIQVYPNPADDILNVTKVSDKAMYKIYSAAGQLVANGKIIGGKINVTSLVKGAYIISIDDMGKRGFNLKFLKK